MNYYLIGIKGTGMSALALMLQAEGHHVMGSDVEEYYFTEDELRKHDILIFPFNSDNIDGRDIYIIGNSYEIKPNKKSYRLNKYLENNIYNPAISEINKIIDNEYQYYYYHEFIGKLSSKTFVGIAGTHGKTTTTSLLTQMLDYQCSYIIGDGTGGSNNDQLMVVEACEYKDHFLAYNPSILIINNIEYDHPDYFKSKHHVYKSFKTLAKKSKIVIGCGDDNLIKRINHPHKITYGFKQDNDYIIKITNKDLVNNGYNIVLFNNDIKQNIFIPFLGLHMIKNFIASYIACIVLNIKPKIDSFNLPKRRMSEYQYKENIIIDDYAHHPSEIRCLHEYLSSKYPDYQQNVIFQPHTYSRTITFKKEFKEALILFNKVYLEDVFTSKRETLNKNKQKIINKYFKQFNRFFPETLKEIDGKGKIIWIFLGAGTVDKYINNLITLK